MVEIVLVLIIVISVLYGLSLRKDLEAANTRLKVLQMKLDVRVAMKKAEEEAACEELKRKANRDDSNWIESI